MNVIAAIYVIITLYSELHLTNRYFTKMEELLFNEFHILFSNKNSVMEFEYECN